MKRLRVVKRQLATATDRRTELWRHGDGSDPALATEVARLSDRIETLWSECRVLTAEIRNGARADIIARARAAERVERDLTRRQRLEPVAAGPR
jgi:ATP-dependent Clp protease ATP-binding subunit ClpA